MIDRRNTKAYKLEKENRELKKRIKEAIEYIKSLEGDYDLELASCVEYELLNILQGADKE